MNKKNLTLTSPMFYDFVTYKNKFFTLIDSITDSKSFMSATHQFIDWLDNDPCFKCFMYDTMIPWSDQAYIKQHGDDNAIYIEKFEELVGLDFQ